MKKIPLRRCLATNESLPQNDMFRIVKTKDGKVYFDKDHSINGRGAYLCKNKEAISKAKSKHLLEKAFRMPVGDEIFLELEKSL